MKTADLTEANLDWAVLLADGVEDIDFVWPRLRNYSPSRHWKDGGPIIEREKISLTPFPNYWEAQGAGVHYRDDALQTGDTPLVAAMRCYVASKLGAEVAIPEGLK